MLGTLFGIYSGVGIIVEGVFGAEYRRLLVEERNEEMGYNNTREDLIDGLIEPLDVNPRPAYNMMVVEMHFDTKEDPIGVILGQETVYLSVSEAKILKGLTEENLRDSNVLAMLAHIKYSQAERARIYTSDMI